MTLKQDWEKKNAKKAQAEAPRDARTDVLPGQRIRRSRNRGAGEVADWAAADSALLSRAIAAVTARGCALRFGYTRDAGAFAVGIIGDGAPYTEYIRPTESIDEFLTGLATDYEK